MSTRIPTLTHSDIEALGLARTAGKTAKKAATRSKPVAANPVILRPPSNTAELVLMGCLAGVVIAALVLGALAHIDFVERWDSFVNTVRALIG
jgi:hypothetical protein